jgi:hypothetical protein
MPFAFLAASHDHASGRKSPDTLQMAQAFLTLTALIEAVLFFAFFRRYRPRCLATIAELERFLPGAK